MFITGQLAVIADVNMWYNVGGGGVGGGRQFNMFPYLNELWSHMKTAVSINEDAHP